MSKRDRHTSALCLLSFHIPVRNASAALDFFLNAQLLVVWCAISAAQPKHPSPEPFFFTLDKLTQQRKPYCAREVTDQFSTCSIYPNTD